MRPAISLISAYYSFNLSHETDCTHTPLIERRYLGYNRQFTPVRMPGCQKEDSTNSGEAEMDRERSNRTNPNEQDYVPAIGSQTESREEKLARIRAEIEAGVYETPEKFEIAISRLLGIHAD